MKKWRVIGSAAVLLTVVLLSGCVMKERYETTDDPQETTALRGATVENVESGAEASQETETEIPLYKIPREEVGIPENMALYSSLAFQYQDAEWKIELYAQGEPGENGEILFDDSTEFFMKVISGDGEYEFFDQQVQLGIPSADVLIDRENRLHIILTDARTAKYEVTDYLYDEQEKRFLGGKMIDFSGINYLGKTEPEGENKS